MTRFLKKSAALLIGLALAAGLLETALWLFASSVHKQHEAPVLPPQTPVIACFGDSFTYGLGASSQDKSYPSQLNALLKQSGSKYAVVNHGVPGSNSAELLKILPGVLNDSRPAAVMVLIGANNLWSLETSWELTDSSLKTTLAKLLFDSRCGRLYRYLASLAPDRPKTQEQATPDKPAPPPSEADIAAMKAAEFMNANELTKAERLYRKAIALDKNNGHHYAGLAQVQTKQIQPAKAFLTATDGVRQASHGKAWLYAGIGDYFAAHQDRISALYWFEKAVSTAIQEGESTQFLTTPLLFNYFVAGQQERGIKFISGLNLPPERRHTLTAILSAQNLKSKLQLWLAHDLKAIRDLCRQSGAQLFLVSYPRQDDRFGVNDQIAALSLKLSVPLVNNHKVFSGRERERDFVEKYFAPDGHCNDSGYKLMADTAYNTLAQQNFK